MLWTGFWTLCFVVIAAVWLGRNADQQVYWRMSRLTRALVIPALFVVVELMFWFGNVAAVGVPPGGTAAGRTVLLIYVGIVIVAYVVFSVSVWKSDRNRKRNGMGAPHRNAVRHHA